jgi:hypothetical protein
VTVRRSAAAAIAKDRAARDAMSRTLAPTRARVAIRAAGPIRVVVSNQVHDLTRRFVGTRNQTPVPVPIRAGARTRVSAQTRTAGLIRRVGSRPHAATRVAARIKVDGSIRVRAVIRSDAPIKTVGRTKALCATISATALQKALVPKLTVTALVAVTERSAVVVANAAAVEDAVAADAVAAVEAKAVTARVHRRAEHPGALARRLPGQKTRLLRKRRRYRRVTVPIGMKAPAMKAPATKTRGIMRTLGTNRLLKRLASGRTIARRLKRSGRLNRTGRRNRSTRRRSLSTASRRLHHV